MNILFLTTHVNTGGISSYILTLGEALVKSGNKVLVASSGGENIDRLQAAGMRHVPFNIRTKSEVHPKLWASLPSLVGLIRDEDIHIIHAQTRVTQVLGFFSSRATGIKMVTTCHGFFRPRWFRRTFPCWGSAVIAISQPVAQHLINDFRVDASKVHLIVNGINLNHFVMTNEEIRQKARQNIGLGNSLLIGIIARLSDVKGIDVLIKAMPGIIKKMPSVKLLIAGQGPEEEFLKKLTEKLSLTDHVQFRNTIKQTQGLLPAFDVFVMPSLMEGLGLSVMEAQACGIPVVASSVGGLVDLIEDGRTGHLVPSNDPSALAEGIIEALQNPQKSKLMAQQARLNIEEYFSAETMARETMRAYQACQNVSKPKE